MVKVTRKPDILTIDGKRYKRTLLRSASKTEMKKEAERIRKYGFRNNKALARVIDDGIQWISLKGNAVQKRMYVVYVKELK